MGYSVVLSSHNDACGCNEIILVAVYLHRDWAHPAHICAGTGLPLPHLRRDWAPPPTSAPGLAVHTSQVRIPRADAVEGDPLHARAVPGVHGLPVDQGPHPRQPPLGALAHSRAVLVHAMTICGPLCQRHGSICTETPDGREPHVARPEPAGAEAPGEGKLRVGPSPGRRPGRHGSGHGRSQPHATRGRGRRVAASVGPAGPGAAPGPGRVSLLPFMRDAHKRASSQIRWRWRAKQIQRTGLAQLHFQEHQLPTYTEDKHRSWLAADGARHGPQQGCSMRERESFRLCAVRACLHSVTHVWACL